jgi:tetratricopeptide repeat protein
VPVSQPIAFMVMPFERKEVVSGRDGAPARVDFDRLWHDVHRPVLAALGYRPVRADSDIGALIIQNMVQRLAIADIVVADISLPNANVYYEIGVRHAAQRHGCVLVAADWAQPVFDVAQMRRLSYPLPDGEVGEAAAEAAKAALHDGLPALIEGASPVFQALPGYPTEIDPAREEAFEGLVDVLSTYGRDVLEIRDTPDPARRRQLTLDLLEEYGRRPAMRQTVVVELIGLLRDHVGAAETLGYIRSLPTALRRHAAVIEQEQIALRDIDDLPKAAAALEELIRQVGPSADRCGILGGRYKRLMERSAGDPAAQRRYRAKAIAAYELGMAQDLNDYYPSCNLPRLYRGRGGPHDEQRAIEVAVVVKEACLRARRLDPADLWIPLTLLGAAFDRGDAAEAEQLIAELDSANVPAFYGESTIPDLRVSYALLPADAQAALSTAMRQVEEVWGG